MNATALSYCLSAIIPYILRVYNTIVIKQFKENFRINIMYFKKNINYAVYRNNKILLLQLAEYLNCVETKMT